jgi:monovalent cation:proton antiporter-2 (CPA2) family protein
MHSGNLEVILVLLLAAVVVVAFFKRLNLSPVLGYLVAGTAIGPHGLNIIKDTESTTYIAEFGVVFLLFYIGLELTLERLSSMKKHVLGFGSLQILLSGLAIGYVAYLLGSPISAAVIIGGGIALSSTAIVLQVLMERGEQSTQVGRLSLAVLIAQDLAVVPLLVIVPLLAQDSGNLAPTIADAVFKAFLATAIIIAFGRIFLRPLFRLMGSLKSRELFAATTLLIVLGAAFATEHFGLSLALGAFMAGLMVAETEYVHQVEADILPFKSLLLGLFFMSVGMHIDIALFTENLALIIILALEVEMTKQDIGNLFSLVGNQSRHDSGSSPLASARGEYTTKSGEVGASPKLSVALDGVKQLVSLPRTPEEEPVFVPRITKEGLQRPPIALPDGVLAREAQQRAEEEKEGFSAREVTREGEYTHHRVKERKMPSSWARNISGENSD